jgi:hypothetical protein
MTGAPVVLLDLQGTLADSRMPTYPPPARWVEDRETYRPWLIAALRDAGYVVELITHRPADLELATMGRIYRQAAGWLPDRWWFRDNRATAPEWKRQVLTGPVFAAHGTDTGRYLALESNPATRAMYQAHGIRAVPVPRDGAPLYPLPHPGLDYPTLF